MSSSSSGASLKMKPQSSSLFSLVYFLLLPVPSLFYSLKNCTVDFYDQSKIVCGHFMLNTIPSDIPKSASCLTVSYNYIERIKQTDLNGLTRLKTLDLESNNISHTEDGAFQDLTALMKLIMSNNKLTNLTDNMFKGLSNLLLLDLENNQIKSISKLAFEPLKDLSELYLSSNRLVQMNDIYNIVSHCSLLEVFDLGSNYITSFESNSFPFHLLKMTKLCLGLNPLRRFSVHSAVFPNLKFLSMSFLNTSILEWDVSDKVFLNSLKSLSLTTTGFPIETYRLIFQSAKSVENLYLAAMGVQLKNLLDIACGLLSVRRLYISVNHISTLNDTLLQSCTNLTELDLSENSIKDLSKSSLQSLKQLTWLDIRANELSHVPLGIRNITTLTFLSLESNFIRELQCSDFLNLPLLRELNLKSNNIYKLDSCVFKELHNLKVLELQNNFLTQFDDSFDVSLPNLVTLNVSQNNVGFLQKAVFQNMSFLTDLNLKSKAVANVEVGAFEGLFNLKRLNFSVNYKGLDIFRGLEYLESLDLFLFFYQGIGQFMAFEPMSFNYLHSLQKLTIEVEKNVCFYDLIFTGDLNKLLEFSVDTTCCSNIFMFTFYNTPHLMNLKIINCNDLNLDPDIFKPIPDLEILDLSHNKIRSLDFLLKANLTKLEKLILVNNELMVINETVFEALPSLKYLDFSGNPFLCDCSNARFIQWAIQNQQVQVVNAFQYKCSSPLSHDEQFLMNFNVQSCWEFTQLLCFISSCATVLVTLLSSFIYHFLRWQLAYGFYLFLAFLYDSKKRRQGCPHIYDAFVSYNVHDEDWVYRELLPELEGRQGWRLCLHHRDFQPGKPIIENITDAIYSSRKTLCVISRHYLQSEWCSREIQMASFRLFDEQKDVLILLFLEEISSNQLSPFYRMRKLVKSRTYLSWTQARSHKGVFWEKVRRALETGNEPEDNANLLSANV